MTEFVVLEQGKVFGIWDAPVTDDHEPINAPVGERCMWCRELIAEGDNGRIAPVWGAGYGGQIEHRECSLRNAVGGIGHLVDHERFCHDVGPDAGLTRRQSSLLAWEYFHVKQLLKPVSNYDRAVCSSESRMRDE
jgi:hypothetical protein